MLTAAGHQIVTLARDGLAGSTLPLDADSSREAWARGLSGIDGIIHLAAIAHRIPDVAALEHVNVRWPLTLFDAAADAGVRQFLFLSSIKVLGDVSVRPFRVDDAYAPGDAYGESKVRAERGLLERHASRPVPRLAIVRSPLVYGPGVKANFRTLMVWADRGRRGLPLPFGAARAPRSFISVTNLCEALIAAFGQSGIYHCADPEDLSVAELLEMLGVPRSRLIPLPAWLMHGIFAVLGRGAVFDRLYRPLQLDCSATRAAIGWSPRQTTAEALSWMLTESVP